MWLLITIECMPMSGTCVAVQSTLKRNREVLISRVSAKSEGKNGHKGHVPPTLPPHPPTPASCSMPVTVQLGISKCYKLHAVEKITPEAACLRHKNTRGCHYRPPLPCNPFRQFLVPKREPACTCRSSLTLPPLTPSHFS